MPVEMQLLCRFFNFFPNCMKNNKNVLKMCSLLAINGSRSSACKNIHLLIHKYIIPRGIITSCGSYYHIKHLMTKHIVHDTPTITLARELIESRDTRSTTLTFGETTLILNELFCSYLMNYIYY